MATYQLTRSLGLEAGYRYTYANTEWQGAAQRPTGAVNQSLRTDQMHLVSVGMGMAF